MQIYNIISTPPPLQVKKYDIPISRMRVMEVVFNTLAHQRAKTNMLGF